MLLYADDIFSEGLQQALDALFDYCDKWSLRVNVDKTKVVVFSRGKIWKMPTIKYKGRSLEVVFEFQCLGVCFNYNNKCNIAQKSLYDKASRAMFGLLKKCRKLMLPLDIQTELFDRVIVPIFLYGCEVWCPMNLASKLQLRFYKIILKLSNSTPSYYYQSYYCYWSLLYSAILRSRADSLRSHVILHEWIAFYSAFLFYFLYPPKWCTYSAGMAGATRNRCLLGTSSVYTIQPCTMSLHAKPHT